MSKQQKIAIAAGAVIILAAIISWLLLRPKPLVAPTVESGPQQVVAETIKSFDPADPLSFLAIQNIIDLGEEAVDPLLDLVNSPNIIDQWAAVVGLSALREDLEQQEGIAQVFRNMYESEFLTIRLQAAASNAQYGDLSGGPVLLEGLKSGEIMSFMEPPTPTAVFANRVLEWVSGEDYGFAENKQEAIIKWERWWTVKEMEGNL